MSERRESDWNGERGDEPTRAYEHGEWRSFADDEPSAGDEPTRAYDTAALREGGATSADRAEHRTDEIELTRPLRYDDSPPAAAHPAPGDEPTRAMPAWQPEHGASAQPYPAGPVAAPVGSAGASVATALPAGLVAASDPGGDALHRLERTAPGPGGGARVTSLLVSLLAIAPLIWAVWDLRGAPRFESVLVDLLTNRLELPLELAAPAVAGAVMLLLAIIGLCAGLSGLGPAVAGLVALVAAAVIWFVARAETESMLLGLAGPAVLLAVGALLVGAGIGAHFARRGGYRRALRIVRDAHRW